MQWIAPYLKDHCELCLVELPVSVVHNDQSYEILCDYIEHRYLNLLASKTCWVLGESFSGPIAVLLAKRHPQKIVGVILAASFITCPHALAKKLKKLLFALLPVRFGRERMGAFFLIGRDVFRKSSVFKKEIIQALSSAPTPTLIERFSTAMECDLRPVFPLVQPVLYLQAKRDWIVLSNALKTIQAQQPDLKHVTLDAPHLILQIKPQESALAIQQFITDNSP